MAKKRPKKTDSCSILKKNTLLDCPKKQPLQSQKIIKIFSRTQMKGFWIGLGLKHYQKKPILKTYLQK